MKKTKLDQSFKLKKTSLYGGGGGGGEIDNRKKNKFQKKNHFPK